MHSPMADSFFWLVSEGWIFYPLFIFLAIYIYRLIKIKYLLSTMVCIGMVVLFSDQTATITKKTIQRYRPSHNTEISSQVHTVSDYKGGKYGFFSGHAANTSGVAAFLFFLLAWVRPAYRYSIFIWPLLVGYSRIYLGVHYPSDILMGYVNGFIWGYLGYLLFKLILKKQYA